MGYSINYNCLYTSPTLNVTCNCALYTSTFPGRDGGSQGETTEGAVSIIPAGRDEVNVRKEIEEEIREVFVVKRDEIIPVISNGTERQN